MEAAEPRREDLANPVKRYLLATRPPFLVAAMIPVLIGVGWFHRQGGSVDYGLALLTLIGAVLAHAAANVLNDYYDDINGTDRLNTGRIFPFTGGSRFIQNGVMSRAEVGRFGAALVVAVMVLGLVLIEMSGPGLLYVGLAGLLLGWAYSAPPLSFNSHGLGEPSIAIGFGYLIPSGSYYVQASGFDLGLLWVVTPFAILATCLLYINQFPDRLADAEAGKHHWVVRLEPDTARWGYLMLVLFAYALPVVMVGVGVASPWILLGLLGAPFSLIAALQLLRYAREPKRLATAIKMTILAMVVHGVGLFVGLLMI